MSNELEAERSDASTSKLELEFEESEPIWGDTRALHIPARSALSNQRSYYALLNVDEQASEQDISKQYKALSLLLHPDRQPENRRSSATQRFEALHKAYEVLSDSHKRAVYDLLGEEGLKTTWEVSKNKAKSAAELRAEFQSQAWERFSADAENAVKSQGDVTCTLDGRALSVDLINGHRPTITERFSYISRRQLAVQHSFNVPVSSSTTATFKAAMVHQASKAGGNVTGTIRHHFSPKVTGQIGTTFLHPYVTDTKLTYAIEKDSFVTFTSVSRPITTPPLCTLTYGQALLPGITTFCTFKSGAWSLPFWRAAVGHTLAPSFAIGASSNSNKWSAEIESATSGTTLTADQRLTVLGNVKVSTGIAASTSGSIALTLSGEKRITTDTRLGMIFTFPIIGKSAVILRVRLSRLGQKITVPIIMTPLRPKDLLTVIAVPAVSMAALHHLYLLPRKRRKVAAKLSELREDNWQLLGRRKAEALDAIELMREPVAKRAAAERAKADGLVILSAVYGPTARTSEDVDVTVPIQALVVNSALIIPGGRSKSGLLGFYDPCIGEAKRLVIRYSFRDREHEATFDDLAGVTAPLRFHLISPV